MERNFVITVEPLNEGYIVAILSLRSREAVRLFFIKRPSFILEGRVNYRRFYKLS